MMTEQELESRKALCYLECITQMLMIPDYGQRAEVVNALDTRLDDLDAEFEACND